MYNTDFDSAQLKYQTLSLPELHSEPPDSSLAANFSCSTLLLTVDSYSIFKQAVMRKESSPITHHMAFFCACVCARVCLRSTRGQCYLYPAAPLCGDNEASHTDKNSHHPPPAPVKPASRKKSFPSVDSASSHFGLCVFPCEGSHTSRPHTWEFPSAGLFLRLVLTC